MSHLAREWAEEIPVANIYERVLLMRLANRAFSDGTAAFPSRTSLARTAMCSVKSVQRHLAVLRARKVIALGDQAAAGYIPANRRPTVYDLLIPYDWYSPSQLKQVNREREERGLPPLAADERPPMQPAPAKRARADKGKPRRAATTAFDAVLAAGEETFDPAEDDSADDLGRLVVPPVADGTHTPLGGLQVPSRGDYKSGPGGTCSPPNQSLKKTGPRNPKERGAYPPNPPAPAAAAAGPHNGGDVAKGVTTDGDQRKSALHARARELAGPEAVAAVTADSSITENELIRVISQASPQLTQRQCVGRAATLLAWEHKRQRAAATPMPSHSEGGRDTYPQAVGEQACTSPESAPDLAERRIS